VKTILFATGNEHKALEVKALFKPFGITIVTLQQFDNIPQVEEDRPTFEGNAKKKAETIQRVVRLPVIADDSGLCVDRLDGKPGVHSARFAGENATDTDNNRKLVRLLREYDEPYYAKFVCCAVFYDGSDFITANGTVPGIIVTEARGSEGFGYDPHFVPEGYDKTMAELGLKIKNSISHRARAFNRLLDKLKERI
jgi:XTP/dITP diphosphohydrolase